VIDFKRPARADRLYYLHFSVSLAACPRTDSGCICFWVCSKHIKHLLCISLILMSLRTPRDSSHMLYEKLVIDTRGNFRPLHDVQLSHHSAANACCAVHPQHSH
jgi:hypothetical protein